MKQFQSALCVLVALFCLTVSTTTLAGEEVRITDENIQQLVGWWEGKWSGSGFNGDMEVFIEDISKSGKITGSRMYTNSSLDTVGQITNSQLELDVEKGANDSIMLSLYKDNKGKLYMEGTYRTHLDGQKYNGKIYDLKKANY